jgi:hypothetical protein
MEKEATTHGFSAAKTANGSSMGRAAVNERRRIVWYRYVII